LSPENNAKRKPAYSRVLLVAFILLVLTVALLFLVRSIGVVSTDDAYINGHFTFVAPRVAGQVKAVFVEDNNRVRKGDRLVELDKEPYLVALSISRSAVETAEADVNVAIAQARAKAAEVRALRFALEHAIEEVENQRALLPARIATLQANQATLDRARTEYDRNLELSKTNAASRQELETYQEAFLVAQARVEEALQGIYQVRASLGLPVKPENGDLSQVPADIDQTASQVRQAQASLIQSAVQLGVVDSLDKPPRQMIADFYKRDPEGNIDRIYEKLVGEAPSVRQAQAKLEQARRQLDQARLNLSYCDVVAEIDGVVTRRSVNAGNNVALGQSLMALRSVSEIWIDANFKETQIGKLRIGQEVDVEVDMYGGDRHFKGRVSGFTMGTGSTLALLPPQNATGNYVKVVQRLPVRIELIDYNPDEAPLFIGLSVTPRVFINRAATGANAGAFLQPYATAPRASQSRSATQPATEPAR
jgi:membrane fusion protein (multidrug efflux system)